MKLSGEEFRKQVWTKGVSEYGDKDMNRTINRRHWNARLNDGQKPCVSCGIDASWWWATVDTDDVVVNIDWFCDTHRPDAAESVLTEIAH